MADISFMGVGSGILNQDMLDAYRKDLERASIEPLVKSMQTNLDKQKSLTELISLVETLKTATKKFNDLDTYMQRTSKVTGEGVSATIGMGTALQDIKIAVHQLAKGDVTQLGKKFESRDSVFSSVNTTLEFNHNGKDYKIDIKANQTVGEVAQAITDATDGAVMGIVMKTGGSQPYQLMIQSKDTGESNRVYFGNTVTSGNIKGGALTGNFSLTLKDKNGNDKNITVDLNTTNSSSSQDNAIAIKKAIEDAISADADLKDLLDNGDLNIGLVNDGKGFVINDKRGDAITINNGTLEVKDIGLTVGTSGGSSNAFQSNVTMQGGAFTGKLKVADVDIDLSTLTAAGNTGDQNLQAIVNHINTNSQEIDATIQDGKLVLNPKAGQTNPNVQITFDTGNSDADNAKIINSLGIVPGNHASSQSFLKDIGLTTIQTAQDAKFSWNGIEISRPTNTVDDVVSGISVELTKEHKSGDHAVIRITRDDDKVFEGIDKFVEAYNELITKVEELTRFDPETKISGIFNGETSIRSIPSSLKSILNFSAGAGSNVSMSTYGFTINDDGKLMVDQEKLKKQYKDDPELALSFFKGGEVLVGGIEIPKKRPDGSIIDGEFERIGGSKVNVKGFFTQFAETIDGLVTGANSTLKSYEQSLKTEYKKSEEQKKAQQERVDSRVAGIKQRFNAYDGMIAQMNTQMQQLQQMMNASMAK